MLRRIVNTIEVDKYEQDGIRSKFEYLVERRENHNQKLSNLIGNLSNVESSGFVEGIVEKLEEHINDVNQNHISNLRYSVDFLNTLAEQFEELDNIIK